MNYTVCKINLSKQNTFNFHRNAWNFAVNALQPLHNDRGIYFDDVIENNCAWKHNKTGKRSDFVLEKMKKLGLFTLLATSLEKGITPYTQPRAGLTQLAQSLSRSLLVGGGELMAGWVRFQKNCGSSKGNKPCNTWQKAREASHVLHN